jgi:peroxiredoxin family protein
VFFTFYGLNLLRRDLSSLKVSPLGNPAMPMKMPFGPAWLRDIDWRIPNAVQSIVPGFESLATALMKRTIQDKGVAAIADLRAACLEGGVKLIACQMTVDLFGFTQSDFIAEVSDYCGAATFLPMAQKADVSLFI